MVTVSLGSVGFGGGREKPKPEGLRRSSNRSRRRLTVRAAAFWLRGERVNRSNMGSLHKGNEGMVKPPASRPSSDEGFLMDVCPRGSEEGRTIGGRIAAVTTYPIEIGARLWTRILDYFSK